MVIRRKKQKQCLPKELEVGDCWIGISLANTSGLILAARVGKHTEEMIEELVVSTEGKQVAKDGIVIIGEDRNESFHQKFCTISVKIRHSDVRVHKWHPPATNGSMASQTEQVWQIVGANKSDNPIGGELLQLDLAAQSPQNHCGSTSRTNI